jgi:hypothetical protein
MAEMINEIQKIIQLDPTRPNMPPKKARNEMASR